MKKMKWFIALICSLVLAACSGEQSSSYVIGAAREGSSYNLIAEAIAEVGNSVSDGIPFTVSPSSGSEENIRNVVSGKIPFAIVQADILGEALSGEGIFNGESGFDSLRAIAGLYPESVQIVTRREYEIHDVPGLWGSVVSVGDVHSGTELNAFDILKAANLNESLVETVNYKTAEACEALRKGDIHAFFYTTSAPAVMIEDLAKDTDIELISMSNDIQKTVASGRPYYEPYEIPAGTYRNQSEPVRTISMKSVLITSQSTDAAFVEALVEQLFDHREEVEASLEMKFTFSEAEATSGIPVSFHEGAKAYYAKKGIQLD